MEFTAEQSRALLDLARATVLNQLSNRGSAEVQTADPALQQPAGCFVSLHRRYDHALRGCVGTMQAVEPLIHVVQKTSRSVLGDPRFAAYPVTLSELPQLEIEISVLSPLRPAAGPLEFDLLNDGIHLTIAGQSGVFLPQVARETGWTHEQLLARLCTEKLGMPPTAWQLPQADLKLFSTVVVGPAPFFERQTG